VSAIRDWICNETLGANVTSMIDAAMRLIHEGFRSAYKQFVSLSDKPRDLIPALGFRKGFALPHPPQRSIGGSVRAGAQDVRVIATLPPTRIGVMSPSELLEVEPVSSGLRTRLHHPPFGKLFLLAETAGWNGEIRDQNPGLSGARFARLWGTSP
jgi:hypothetical protein